MKFRDSRRIAATPAEVWAILTSPEALKEAIPGCVSLRGDLDKGFDLVSEIKLGTLKARPQVKITFDQIAPEASLVATARLKRKGAENTRAVAHLTLTADNGSTLLAYRVEGEFTGTIAKLGSIFLTTFARRQVNDVFTVVKAKAEATTTQSPKAAKGWLGSLMGTKA